ncbi:copper chaperone PCu(A)C [Paraburkholderia phenoliruptrix]|uniref:copper chaperone PCu(A)C n=1 Tax=Paraburkholderia phenoliruptrix TaxID=252970 RepID=UPI001C6F06DD|nr:copper chaperone PCu(A)C [Paraburkholderia phenoliruptrix]MBW9106506.1 copper chaperone PCu(A)C [Paraburkholderia phenoliruptrix]MBW9131482.1 copper chaperone PCu(A)C [Paraburkholderia ginsengiterrae]
MTTKVRTLSASAAAALSLSLSLAFVSHVQAAAPQAITAKDAWVRWLPNNLPAAGYVTLVNAGDKPVDLVDVSSSDYGDAMLHQTVSNGSSQKMVMVDKLTVPAHGQVAIAPGGYHLMLEDAKHKIAPGDTVHLKLKFSDGATLDTPFAVKSPAQTK